MNNLNPAELRKQISDLMNQYQDPSKVAKHLKVRLYVVYRHLERLGWRYGENGWEKLAPVKPAPSRRPRGVPPYPERIYQLARRCPPITPEDASLATGCAKSSARRYLAQFCEAPTDYLTRQEVEGTVVRGYYIVRPDRDPYKDGFFAAPDHPVYQEDFERLQAYRKGK